MLKQLIALLTTLNIYAAGELKAVTGPDYPPFTTSKQQGGGKAVKLIREVFKIMNTKLNLKWMPWVRAEEMTKNGDFDFIFPYVKNTERKKNFIFSRPIYKINTYIYTKKEKSQLSLEKFFIEHKKICWPVGYNSEDLEKYIKQYYVKLVRPSNMKTCFLMLNKGRVDGVHSNNYLASSLLQELSLKNIRPISKILSKKKLHVMFPKKLKKSKKLVKEFNKALKKVTEFSQ